MWLKSLNLQETRLEHLMRKTYKKIAFSRQGGKCNETEPEFNLQVQFWKVDREEQFLLKVKKGKPFISPLLIDLGN